MQVVYWLCGGRVLVGTKENDMRYQLWIKNGCLTDMVCDVPDSDNKLENFVASVQHWLKEEPSPDYRILIGDQCIGD